MALIICKSCGKKVSDTVDVCIHCGQNPKEEIVEKVEEPTVQEPPAQKKAEYYDLSEREQIALEAEFAKQDKSAKKYLLDAFELSSFMKPILFYPILAFVLVRGLFTLAEMFDILNTETANETLSGVAAVSGIGLIVLCACMFIYGLVKKIYNRITNAYLIYLKKFQKWLKENKDIDFYPELEKARQKAFFESINID